MTADDPLMALIKSGTPIDADSPLSPAYRGEVIRLITIFVDTELAWAAGYVDQINRAPGVRERVVAAQIVAEKFDHAERGLDLLEAFGVKPALYVREHAWTARLDRNVALGTRRVGNDKRLNVLHYPVEGWTDAVVMNTLMGPATILHLTELANASYTPLATIMPPILSHEATHAAQAEKGVAQAITRQGKAPAQAAVDYWYPKVAETFGLQDSDRYDLYARLGLRIATNAELLNMWQADIRAVLDRLGLSVPA